MLIGSIDHYCDNNNVETNFVKLKHRQIWTDALSCSEVRKDGKILAAFKSGDVPTRRILLTVRQQIIMLQSQKTHYFLS